MDKLTPKQERFANEYIKTLNVTQSAIKAGYSPNSAHVTGSRLLRKDKVDEYIKSKRKTRLWTILFYQPKSYCIY